MVKDVSIDGVRVRTGKGTRGNPHVLVPGELVGLLFCTHGGIYYM